MSLPQNKAGIIWGLIVLLAAGIFIWELMTPLGQVEWLFYVPVLLLTMWLPYRRATYIAAGAFTVLIIAGHFLSPPGGFPNLSVFNRSENVISDHRSLGLIGMRERAHACGGNVTVSCPPGGGTVVTARIPLPRAERA